MSKVSALILANENTLQLEQVCKTSQKHNRGEEEKREAKGPQVRIKPGLLLRTKPVHGVHTSLSLLRCMGPVSTSSLAKTETILHLQPAYHSCTSTAPSQCMV